MKYLILSLILLTGCCSLHDQYDIQYHTEQPCSGPNEQKLTLIQKSYPVISCFSFANKRIYLYSKRDVISEKYIDTLESLMKKKTEEIQKTDLSTANCLLTGDSLYIVMANTHDPTLLFDSLNIIYTSYLGKATILWSDHAFNNPSDFEKIFGKEDIASINNSSLPVIRAIYMNHKLSFIMTDY